MDLNIESPFSFDLGEELFPLPSLSGIDIPLPHFPSISPFQNNNNTVSQTPKTGRRKNPPPPPNTSDDIADETPNEHKKKKIIHRDLERQRRQQMSSLYSTLRSLLPLQYLKGKRSICDHMQETVKYILYMQSKIQQLSNKREELKNSTVDLVETLNSSKRDLVTVVVRPRNESGGVQVILDTVTQHRLHVSNILEALVAEGLEIISYISTKINDRFLHTIESQVVVSSDGNPSIDLSELQHKLTNLEYFPLD